MVNQLSKFTPNIATLTKPHREFLGSKKSWNWGQFQAFKRSKQLSVLAMYSPDADTKVCSDASSYGLGAVLLQQQSGRWQSVVDNDDILCWILEQRLDYG